MPINRFLRRIIVLVLAVSSGACASTRQSVEQLPPDSLYERALAYLHARKWTDAQEDFERFVISYPAHPRVQEARLRLGDAYFGKKEYVTAANEYSRLANDYPAGPYADDARFKVCESYFRLSPKPQLDQQYTKAALDHCQSLETYYPNSEFAPRAQSFLMELRTKLAEKEFLAGEFYFKRNAYDPAIIYYDNVVRDYADTTVSPRALKRLYDTYQKLGYKEEAETAKQRLLKEYPSSGEAKLLQTQAVPTKS